MRLPDFSERTTQREDGGLRFLTTGASPRDADSAGGAVVWRRRSTFHTTKKNDTSLPPLLLSDLGAKRHCGESCPALISTRNGAIRLSPDPRDTDPSPRFPRSVCRDRRGRRGD